jgi:hypothetical protein
MQNPMDYLFHDASGRKVACQPSRPPLGMLDPVFGPAEGHTFIIHITPSPEPLKGQLHVLWGGPFLAQIGANFLFGPVFESQKS